MRMLYVVEDRFPPFRADVVELFARQMTQRGHRIDWVMRRTPAAAEVPSPAQWERCTVHLPPVVTGRGRVARLKRVLADAWGDLRVLALAVRGRYDVIQVRDRYVVALWAWLAARLTGARFCFWMSYPYAESKLDQARQGFVPHPWLTSWRGRFIHVVLYRLVLPRADHVFVQSEQMRRDVAREGIDPSRMTPVPMGIRDDQVGQSADARAPDAQAPVLLYLGILLRLRQTEMLVDVLHRVRQRVPGARLVYVGEGVHPSDRQAIVDEARRLGEEQAVEITGFLPMEQAWSRVRQADICFSPFQPIPVLQSTSPTKLIEYMAMAKCVVGNEHPEQGQVMRESGVGAPVVWDVQAFADAVLALLADPEAARRQAARGPDFVRRWRTYGVIADAVEGQYLRLINQSSE